MPPSAASSRRWQVCQLTSVYESQVDALKSRPVCACSPAVRVFLSHVPAEEVPAVRIALAGAHLQGRQPAKHSQLSGLQQGSRASHICIHIGYMPCFSGKAGSVRKPRLTHTADCQNIIIGVLCYGIAAAQRKGHACRTCCNGDQGASSQQSATFKTDASELRPCRHAWGA